MFDDWQATFLKVSNFPIVKEIFTMDTAEVKWTFDDFQPKFMKVPNFPIVKEIFTIDTAEVKINVSWLSEVPERS